jgi:septal ring factor EnvC (AmiA/AmiB activator)
LNNNGITADPILPDDVGVPMSAAFPQSRVGFPSLLMVCLGLVFGVATATEPDAAAAKQKDLTQIRSRIETIRKAIETDVGQRDALSHELKSAEQQVQSARTRLASLRTQRQASEAKLAELRAQRVKTEQAIAVERGVLADELRMAYMSGNSEQLQLVLNQQDAAAVGRMMSYYGYLGRARAERIAAIDDQMAQLDLISESVTQETERLKALEQESAGQVDALAQARQTRRQTLAAVQETLKTRSDELARLQREAQALEKLIDQLRRAMEDFPVLSAQPFDRVRGKLPWPTSGKLLARFGQPRGGTLKWQGVLIAAPQGAQVRAPFHGRVIYADWLPGLGQLLILDHGGGYLSLYGHNSQLFKGVGDVVQPGDVIAGVGDSGGRAQTGLYVEIRKGKEALDPSQWFRKP